MPTENTSDWQNGYHAAECSSQFTTVPDNCRNPEQWQNGYNFCRERQANHKWLMNQLKPKGWSR